MSESIVNLKKTIHQLTLENRKLKDDLICEEKKYKRKILDLEYKIKIYELEYNIDVDKFKKAELKNDINVDKSIESDYEDKENEMVKKSENKLNEIFNYFISQNQIIKHQEVNVAAVTNEGKKSIAENHSVLQSPQVVKKEESVVQYKANSNNKATNSSKENCAAWKNDCLQLIDAILDNPDSGPFREPISLKDYPNYKAVIKEPIDFGEIREKLLNDEYQSINEFDYDCNLVFINSELFFTNKKSKIYAQTLSLADFYDSRIDEISKKYKQDLKIQPLALPNKKSASGGDLMNELLNLTANVDQKRADSGANPFKSPGFFYYRPKNKKNSNQTKQAEEEIKTQMESTRDEDDENEKPAKQEGKKDVTPRTKKRNRKQFSYRETSSDSETEEDVKKQTIKQITPKTTHKKQRRSDIRHVDNSDST